MATKWPISGAADSATARASGIASASVATRCRCGSTVTTASNSSASSRPITFWLITSPGAKALSCRM